MHLSRIFALLTAATALFGATGTDSFHWSGKLPAGQLIEIRGINGNIHAVPAPSDSVDVIASKGAETIDPVEIDVKVIEHDGGVTICAVYPSTAERPNECMPNDGSLNTAASVDFTVRVPRGVRFVGRTVNGLVEAQSLDSDAEAHTVNGNVRLSTAGTAQGDTVNGSIVASVGRITSATKFSTVNGGITLEVPRATDAHVHARTVNGRINTDFPLAVRGQFFDKRADGAIGHGGPELRLATVNGTINLKHRRRTSCL